MNNKGVGNRYFTLDQSLYDITNKYPETIPVFVSAGFEQLKDDEKRKSFGKSVSLRNALFFRKINSETFSQLLTERIELAGEERGRKKNVDDIKIEGLLPCPVRIPLTEALDRFISDKGNGIGVSYELKAASMGLDWLKEILEEERDPEKLSDIFISAGFDLFFDENLMGKFKNQGVFKDLTGFSKLNPDFDNKNIDLKDPKSHYSMIGVVPAVFLVNTTELNGRPLPKSWEDILDPAFENSISLPIGDFDLFNAILLNVEKNYGEKGVKALGRNLLESLHPSQMVKSGKQKENRPVVTIMPYFFTKMAKGDGPMKPVWPEDGAIISPIFMLSKSSKREKLKPLVDFFSSVEVGEILSHNGLFPSTNPNVDNRLPEGSKFMWMGWDYIYNSDIAGLIKRCEKIFNSVLENQV